MKKNNIEALRVEGEEKEINPLIEMPNEKALELLRQFRYNVSDKLENADSLPKMFKFVALAIEHEIRDEKEKQGERLPNNILRDIKMLLINSYESIIQDRMDKDLDVEKMEGEDLTLLMSEDAKLAAKAQEEYVNKESIEKAEEINIEKVSFEDLQKKINLFENSLESENGKRILDGFKQVLEIDGAGIKGGGLRLMAKIFFRDQVPENMIKEYDECLMAEIDNFSDIDVVLDKSNNKDEALDKVQNIKIDLIDKKGKKEKKIEIHPEDVESINNFSDKEIIEEIGEKDTHNNQLFLSKDKGFVFTPEAKNDILNLRVSLVKNKNQINLYGGKEYFSVGDKEFFAAGPIYRALKQWSFGKAKYFELPAENAQIDLGYYWGVLIRSALGKENQENIISNIFVAAKKMEQTEANSSVEFVEGFKKKYPEFKFGGKQSPVELGRWIIRKYLRFGEFYIRNKYNIYRENELGKDDENKWIDLDSSYKDGQVGDQIRLREYLEENPLRDDEELPLAA